MTGKHTVVLYGLTACNLCLLLYSLRAPIAPPEPVPQHAAPDPPVSQLEHDAQLLSKLKALALELDTLRGEMKKAAADNRLGDLQSELDNLRETVSAQSGSRGDRYRPGPGSPPQSTRLLAAWQQGHTEDTSKNYANNIAAQYANSPQLSSAYRDQLENVSDIFEDDDLQGLSFGRADCVEGMCRIEYSHDNPGGSGTPDEILENELIARLGKKYGNGTEFVSSGAGHTRTMFIKLNAPR